MPITQGLPTRPLFRFREIKKTQREKERESERDRERKREIESVCLCLFLFEKFAKESLFAPPPM